MDRRPEADLESPRLDQPLVLEPAQRREQRHRIAFARVDDAAVQQREGSRIEGRCESRAGLLGSNEALFVVAVLDHDDAFGRFRVALPVHACCAGGGEDAPAGLTGCKLFDIAKLLPSYRIGRVAFLRHRVAKVGDPRQAAASLQSRADQMRRGDRIGRPDRVGPELADHSHALADGVEPPTDPAVGSGHEAGIALAHCQMARGVEGKGAAHDGTGRDLGFEVVAGALVGAWVGRQHQRLPAESRQVLDEAQGALDAAAARHRREVVGDHQDALHRWTATGRRRKWVGCRSMCGMAINQANAIFQAPDAAVFEDRREALTQQKPR